MKRIRLHLLLTLFFSIAGSALILAEDEIGILDAIQSDSIITISQPEELTKRLLIKNPSAGKVSSVGVEENSSSLQTDVNGSDYISAQGTGSLKTAGYRVQVFSDNNVSTAKSEARTKAQAIQARLPQYRTYVVYQSPYWRLKVGDFTTRTDAENAADEIKKIFPSYAREVRVVKDRINR